MLCLKTRTESFLDVEENKQEILKVSFSKLGGGGGAFL